MENCQSYKERYHQVKYEVLITKRTYERHAEITDEAEKHAQELSNEDYAEIAPDTEHQQADDVAEGSTVAAEYQSWILFDP